LTENKAELAFEILARENSRMLVAYLRTLIDDQSVVDDLYQETMLVAWRRLDEVDLTSPFGPWLRGVARNLVLAHRRKQETLPSYWNEAVLAHIEAQFQSISNHEGDTWDQKVSALRLCIEALSQVHQLAIEGRYFQGLSIEDLAVRLEASVEACKKRLVRARKLLAECLERKQLFAATEGQL